MFENSQYLEREASLSKLAGGRNFATLNPSESADIAIKALKILSKTSSIYLKIFIKTYWNKSLSISQKTDNISALITQLKEDQSVPIQKQSDDYSVIEFFLSLLKRKKKLKVSIEYGELMFS